MHVLTTRLYQSTTSLRVPLKQRVLSFQCKTLETSHSRNHYLHTIATRLTTIACHLQRNQASVLRFIEDTLTSSTNSSMSQQQQQQQHQHGRHQSDEQTSNEITNSAQLEPLQMMTRPQQPFLDTWRDHFSRDERVKCCRYIMAKLISYYPNVSEDSLKQRTRSFEAKTWQTSKSRDDYLRTIASSLAKVDVHCKSNVSSSPPLHTKRTDNGLPQHARPLESGESETFLKTSSSFYDDLRLMMQPQPLPVVTWRVHFLWDERLKICRHMMTKIVSYFPAASEDALKEGARMFEIKIFHRSKSKKEYFNAIASGLDKIDDYVTKRKASTSKPQTNSLHGWCQLQSSSSPRPVQEQEVPTVLRSQTKAQQDQEVNKIFEILGANIVTAPPPLKQGWRHRLLDFHRDETIQFIVVKLRAKHTDLPIDSVEQQARSIEELAFQKSNSLEQYLDIISDDLLKSEGEDRQGNTSVNVNCEPILVSPQTSNVIETAQGSEIVRDLIRPHSKTTKSTHTQPSTPVSVSSLHFNNGPNPVIVKKRHSKTN